jgi:NTP pyrophosphatase (non-canonical NTP hydrolase)
MNRSFRQLLDRINRFRDDRDWKQFHDPRSLATALSIEASELLEHFNWKDRAAVEKYLEDPIQAEEVRDEVADVFVYLLELADILKIDLEDAAQRKMDKNERKYPVELARGVHLKYDTLAKTPLSEALDTALPSRPETPKPIRKQRKNASAKLSELMKE